MPKPDLSYGEYVAAVRSAISALEIARSALRGIAAIASSDVSDTIEELERDLRIAARDEEERKLSIH